MTEVDGDALIRELREKGYRGPIVLMTYNTERLRKTGLITLRNHPLNDAASQEWHYELTQKGIEEFGENTIVVFKVELDTFEPLRERIAEIISRLHRKKTVTKDDLPADKGAVGPRDSFDHSPYHLKKDRRELAKTRFFQTQIPRGEIEDVYATEWPPPSKKIIKLFERIDKVMKWRVLSWILKHITLGYNPRFKLPEFVPTEEFLKKVQTWNARRVSITLAGQDYRSRAVMNNIQDWMNIGVKGFLVASGSGVNRRIAKTVLSVIRSKLILLLVLIIFGWETAVVYFVLSILIAVIIKFLFVPMNAFKILRLLTKKKAKGELDEDFSIEAVGNPYTDSIRRLEAKRDAGAQRILIQMPLLWNDFMPWWERAQASPKLRGRIVVSMGYVVNFKKLQFMYFLGGIKASFGWLPGWFPGAKRRREAYDLLRYFESLKNESKEDATRLAREWNEELERKIRALKGFAGIHYMDIAWRQLARVEIDQLMERLRKRQGFPVVYSGMSYKESANVADLHRTIVALDRIAESCCFDNSLLSKKLARIYLMKTLKPNIFQPAFSLRLRQLAHLSQEELEERIRQEFTKVIEDITDDPTDMVIEEHTPYGSSLLQERFNRAYWADLDGWNQSKGKDYLARIGGSPDKDEKLIEYLATEFLKHLTEVVEEEGVTRRTVYYEEDGAAALDFGKILMGHILANAEKFGFTHINPHLGVDFILTDYIPAVLAKAREELGNDFRGLKIHYKDETHDYYRRILWNHATNVFDLLRSEKLARFDDEFYLIHEQTSLPESTLEKIAQDFSFSVSLLRRKIKFYLSDRTDVDGFLNVFKGVFATRGNSSDFYRFWQALWDGFEIKERLVHVPDLKTDPNINAAPGLGAVLEDRLAEYEGDLEIIVPTQAINKAAATFREMHPKGVLEIIDASVVDIENYSSNPRYLMPLAYEGSFNWRFNDVVLGWYFESIYPNFQKTDENLARFGWPSYTRTTLRINESDEDASASSDLAQAERLEEKHIDLILRKAADGLQLDGTPFASLAINEKTGEFIAGSRPKHSNEQLSITFYEHSEMNVLQKAIERGWDMSDIHLVLLAEPCQHCAFDIINNFRPKRVSFFSYDAFPNIRGIGVQIVQEGQIPIFQISSRQAILSAKRFLQAFYDSLPPAVLQLGKFSFEPVDWNIKELASDARLSLKGIQDILSGDDFTYLTAKEITRYVYYYIRSSNIWPEETYPQVIAVDTNHQRIGVDVPALNVLQDIVGMSRRLNPKDNRFKVVLLGDRKSILEIFEKIREFDLIALDRVYALLETQIIPVLDIIGESDGGAGDTSIADRTGDAPPNYFVDHSAWLAVSDTALSRQFFLR